MAHYERLRTDVLSSSAEATRAPGLVLFLRQGMKAWIQAWSSCTPDPEAEMMPPPRSNSGHCSWESRQAITNILAGMILNREMEAFR
jgi:hypothetical protein